MNSVVHKHTVVGSYQKVWHDKDLGAKMVRSPTLFCYVIKRSNRIIFRVSYLLCKKLGSKHVFIFVSIFIKNIRIYTKRNKIAICKGEDGERGRSLLFVDYIFLYFDFWTRWACLFKNKIIYVLYVI